MPSAFVMKLIGGAVAFAALLGLIWGLKHYKSLAESRGAKLEVICKSTRDASNIKDLPCRDVPAQIGFMGQAITTLSSALDRQNAANAALRDQNAREQAEAAQAVKAADKRAQRPQATSERLTASSRAPERQAKPCDPSKALTEAWR